VVVMALLGALMLLGFLFYTTAAQEQVSAEYFSDAAKKQTADIDPDVLFDYVLRQVIIGPSQQEYGSALYGGRHSMLPTMLGRDFHPGSGMGINLSWNGGTGRPEVNTGFHGSSSSHLLYPNASVGAAQENLSLPGSTTPLNNYPDPDVDHTSPDINSMFLGYYGQVPNGGGTLTRIAIPSFERPWLLRGATAGPNTWYSDAATARLTLRPHKEHRAVASNGTVTATRRFVSDIYPEGGMNPFPFGTPLYGVWTGNGETYALDADPSDSGQNDSIWIDFNFPMMTSPDGLTTFIPMGTVKIVDGDSLLNLNVHGNAAGNTALRTSGGVAVNPYGNGEFVSRSNDGLRRSEINPQWGLQANPVGGADLQQHEFYYGHQPGNAIELANMEWWWLLTGRPEFVAPGGSSNITDLALGRWGEPSFMRDAWINRLATDYPKFPAPGVTFPNPGSAFDPYNSSHQAADDNRNWPEGGNYFDTPTDTAARVFPAYMGLPGNAHPLDYRGSGRQLLSGTFGKQREIATSGRYPFPRYRNYFMNPGSPYFTANSAQSSGLLPNYSTGYLIDDPSETIIDPTLSLRQDSDSIFPASENGPLQMSAADQTLAGVTNNRVLKLAPFNFVSASSAVDIRKQFTTTSWDLKSFSHPAYAVGGTDVRRGWEFNANIYTAGGSGSEFPPTFQPGSWDAGANGQFREPFRQELRELLTIKLGDQTLVKPQRRFSINGVLDYGDDGRLRFRPLTPHPTGLSNLPVRANAGSSLPARPENIKLPNKYDTSNATTTDLFRQEFVARRDRQLMCRDIFVMLYTFGGGHDGINYTGDNSGEGIYSEAQLKEMAQFAVNWVDALDPDDVVTKFEYDVNLGNGWNLDDDPYTDDVDSSSVPIADRRVVYGVEAQRLAFSEVMSVLTRRVEVAGAGMNHDATEYDDSKPRDFTYFELQNVSPTAVDFTNAGWQVVVTANDILKFEGRKLTFQSGGVSAPSPVDEVQSVYTVGTAGDADNVDIMTGNIRPSYMMINPKHGDADDPMVMTRIAPRGTLSLDLMTSPTSSFRVNKLRTPGDYRDGNRITGDTMSPAGREFLGWLGSITDDDKQGINPGDITLTFRLMRRANLTRSMPVDYDSSPAQHDQQDADNPWVIVDEITCPLQVFTLASGDSGSPTIGTKLQSLFSKERQQPLDGRVAGAANHPTTAATFQFNSLGQGNTATTSTFGAFPAAYTLWHPHFNRDFASIAELFSIPTFAPGELTEKLGELPGSGSIPRLVGGNTAGAKFLRPLNGANSPTITNASLDNRWYRILELLEVPERTPRHPDATPPNVSPYNQPWFVVDAGRIGTGGNRGFFRTPGKINLNTLRYPSVLGAMIDDRDVLTLNTTGSAPFLNDQSGDGGRDWWVQFLRARDGVDPVSGYILPGLPTSKPFRSLFNNFYSNADRSDVLENTILRSLPADGSVYNGRRLFELGNNAEHNNGTIDYTVRNRLLGKVANHSTTRSNVFFVFVQIDYFEAKEVMDGGNPVVRVGGKLATSPNYRGFFVVDRSKALELVNTSHLPKADAGGNFVFSFDQSFDFRQLILHRQQIK